MPSRPLATKDNAVGRLNAGISGATLTIPLQAGQGSLFPTTKNGSASSLGSGVLLNSTGILALGVAAGDIIENVTDGSYAVVRSVSTDAAVTSPLRGGSDNTWQNSDVWAVGRFVATLIQYDTDGVTILKREKVLIKSRATDTLTVETGGRGYDGTTGVSFDASDYLYVLWTDMAHQGLKTILADALVDIGVSIKATFAEIYAVDSVGTDSYAVTLTPAPTAYTDGMPVLFKPGTANTGAATLNVNGLGAKSIRKNYNTALATGDIVAQQRCLVVYDAANDWFQLISWPGVGSATQTEVQTGSLVYSATATGNDAYVATLSPVPAALVNGMTLSIKLDVGNTGPATLNVNSLGAKALVMGVSTPLVTGDLLANQIITVVYNSTGDVFQVKDVSAILNAGQTQDATNLHHHTNLIASVINLVQTANTTEQTVLTATLPSGILSTKHGIRVRLSLLHTAAANGDDVAIRFKLGGTTVYTLTPSAGSIGIVDSLRNFEFLIINNASASAQKYAGTGETYQGATAAVVNDVGTAAVNTAGAVAMLVSTQTADNGTNAVTIHSCTFEYLYTV